MWRRSTATRERRREPRTTVTWTARCRTDPGGELSPCTVVDVSPSGAALELLVDGVAHRDDTIVIEVERVGSTPVMFTLHGIVREVIAADDTPTRRVGLSLAIDNGFEQRIVRAMTAP